ncbi:MAG: GAF domain-containing SpoIIE family protein phosphatase, partial [Armatimonadota bacterium]
MMTIASHVATASRIRLVDHESCPPQVNPVLDRLRRALTATSVDDLLENTLREVVTIVNADSGSIVLYDDAQCRIAAAYNLKGNIDRAVARSVPTMSNYIATHCKPLLLHGPADTSKYPGVVPRFEIASSICTPLKVGKKVLGCLNLNRLSHRRPFGESDLEFTTAYVAQPLSIALEHKRLRLYRDDQASFLRRLYRIAKMITSSLETEEVLDMIMDQLMSVGRADVCGLLLKDDKFGEFKVACGEGIPGGTKDDYANLMMPLAISIVARARPTALPDLNAHHAYTDHEIVRRLGLRSAAVIPLLIKRKNVGFIMVYSRQTASFPQSLLKLLAGLAELAAIAIENARHYERQLGIARITQRLLAPCSLGCIPGFEIGHKYVPAYEVGGDYYDLIRLSENRFGLAVADVSGKDVDAAAHIAMCKHSLRAVADHFDSPSSLLRKMNRLIYENTSPEAFVSMFYGILDTDRRELTFSSAGHDPGLLYRADSRTVERVSTPGILLGIQPDAAFV